MRVKYTPGVDVLVVELRDKKPENDEDILVIDKFQNHTWKLNTRTRQVFYLKIENATEEFGEIWLEEMLAAQLFADHAENTPEDAMKFLLPPGELLGNITNQAGVKQ